MKSIVVFCGSSEGNDSEILAMADELGRTFAQRKIRMIYGGARIGVMGRIAQSALDNEGEVIGIIPDFLMRKEVVHSRLTQLIITRNMHERKLKMQEHSDAVITLPGGYGTLEELFEMVAWAQLGLHHKPIGILNINGFYDDLLRMFQKMVSLEFLKQEYYEMILVDGTVNGLLQKMEDYVPKTSPKWIKKDRI